MCGRILTSQSVHDFNGCGCKNNTFIDGGYDYLRYGAVDIKKVEVLEIRKGRNGKKTTKS